ncbi:MAG: hypothetical protein ACK5JD_08610 [Mangrovibacterium sp.]
MKTKWHWLSLGLVLLILCSASCKKENEIDIAQLVGKWSVYSDDPNLAIDGSEAYTFNTDKTCVISLYDYLSNWDTTMYRSYTVSYDSNVLTLFDEENTYVAQYYIRKLTSGEMVWENASLCSSMPNKKLRKQSE